MPELYYIKRQKNKLEKIKEMMNTLDMLTQEQQVMALGTIEESLDYMSLQNDININKSIEDFDRQKEVIDQEIIRAETILQDQYVKKMELYKKVYDSMIKDL